LRETSFSFLLWTWTQDAKSSYKTISCVAGRLVNYVCWLTILRIRLIQITQIRFIRIRGKNWRVDVCGAEFKS
jgi:hypothetical protein